MLVFPKVQKLVRSRQTDTLTPRTLTEHLHSKCKSLQQLKSCGKFFIYIKCLKSAQSRIGQHHPPFFVPHDFACVGKKLLEQSAFTEHPTMKAIMARVSDQRYTEIQDFVDDFTK